MSTKKHWILFRNQAHYDDDVRWTDVRLRPSHFDELKAEILAQAREKGIDPDSLAFAWGEGFGKLDPAMPKKNVSKMFTLLSQGNGGTKTVRWMKSGEMDTGYYPYGKLWKYVNGEG